MKLLFIVRGGHLSLKASGVPGLIVSEERAVQKSSTLAEPLRGLFT